ncbi:hypothetical protein BH23ACT10_BH23ACT10_01590 [soil metagenome]
MVERTGSPPRAGADARGADGDDGQRDDRAGRSLPASIAASGSWVRERDGHHGWEDLLSEFLAAIATWGGVGWLVDRWLDTGPWFMIAGVVLGNGLGIYLLWLRSDPERAKARINKDAAEQGSTEARE